MLTLLFRAWLWYFFITFSFYCFKLLFNVLLFQVGNYGQVWKQGSKLVALCFGSYGTQVRLYMIF